MGASTPGPFLLTSLVWKFHPQIPSSFLSPSIFLPILLSCLSNVLTHFSVKFQYVSWIRPYYSGRIWPYCSSVLETELRALHQLRQEGCLGPSQPISLTSCSPHHLPSTGTTPCVHTLCLINNLQAAEGRESVLLLPVTVAEDGLDGLENPSSHRYPLSSSCRCPWV